MRFGRRRRLRTAKRATVQAAIGGARAVKLRMKAARRIARRCFICGPQALTAQGDGAGGCPRMARAGIGAKLAVTPLIRPWRVI